MMSILEELNEKSWTVCNVCDANLLTSSFLEKIRSYALSEYEQGHFQEAKVGRLQDKTRQQQIRSDSTLWFQDQSPSTELAPLRDFLMQIRTELNRQFFLSLNNMEFHFARYGVGNHYDAHIDQFQKHSNAGGTRVITLVLYLNPNWLENDAGRLEIYNPEGTDVIARVQPKWGQMILFESEKVLHGVETANAERLSFTGWFRREQVNTI